jgi:hypothetical protein
MDANDQLVIMAQCLYRIAPAVAQYALNRLEPTNPYAMRPDQEFGDHRRQICRDAAALALELASHMAAQYAGYHDAALSSQAQDLAQAQNPAAAHKYFKTHPAEEI